MEMLSLWQTPLFITQNDEHEFIKDDLLADLNSIAAGKTNCVDSHIALDAKSGLYESDLQLLDRDMQSLVALRSYLESNLYQAVAELNGQYWPEHCDAHIEIVESWFHNTENGGFHDVHSHPNCSWCGIYAIEQAACDIKSKNGVNRFYDPRSGAEHYQDAGTLWLSNDGVWDFQPKDGQLILFPSYMKHSALAYFGQKVRTVIAFNAQVHLYEVE